MYVWFDALSNYITGVNGEWVDLFELLWVEFITSSQLLGLDPTSPLSKFWPANVHIIGKDIIWFHCVIWPCMLLSAGVPLPGIWIYLKIAYFRLIVFA
jgi:methionyl-tRNA synthetase